jgi:hypothetical protein
MAMQVSSETKLEKPAYSFTLLQVKSNHFDISGNEYQQTFTFNQNGLGT